MTNTFSPAMDPVVATLIQEASANAKDAAQKLEAASAALDAIEDEGWKEEVARQQRWLANMALQVTRISDGLGEI